MSDITVPELGESVSEATVGEWQVSEGDKVSKDDILVELETDKVSVEVRAEADGTLSKITAEEGDTVEIGAKLGELSSGSGDSGGASSKKEEKAEDKSASDEKDADESNAEENDGDLIEATVPVMGESVSEGTAGAWQVKPGDRVEKDQTLLEIETDKVAVEVPAPEAGTIEELKAQYGRRSDALFSDPTHANAVALADLFTDLADADLENLFTDV